MAKRTKLTDQQEAFVVAYLGDARFNASEAARLAGYDSSAAPWRLKQNEAIRARVDGFLAAKTLTAAEVLSELSEVARAPFDRFLTVRYDKDGNVTETRMDLSAKVKALELLGKAHRLFAEQIDVRMAIRLEAERAAKVYGVDPELLLAEAGRLD